MSIVLFAIIGATIDAGVDDSCKSEIPSTLSRIKAEAIKEFKVLKEMTEEHNAEENSI